VSGSTLNSQAILMMINRSEYLEEFGLHGAESGSLHLFQKYSKTYSIRPPNAEICGVKFIKMMNIKLFGSHERLLIPLHLDKINTFSNLIKDYQVKLVVDKNRISKDNLRTITKIFQKLKVNNNYPEVSYSIKFAEIK
jgi:hypothetical protein